jgi:hypothetical protein
MGSFHFLRPIKASHKAEELSIDKATEKQEGGVKQLDLQRLDRVPPYHDDKQRLQTKSVDQDIRV